MEQVTLNPANKPSIFARLGYLSYRYRALVIIIWAALLLLSLALTPRLDSVLKGIGIVYEAGEASRAEQLLQQELKVNPDALSIVFQSANGQKIDKYQLEVEQIITQVRSLSTVSSVLSTKQHPEYRSTDGSTEYSIINLKTSASEGVAAIASIEQVLAQTNSLSLKTYLTGKPVVDIEAQRISKADLSKAEAIALPLTLITLIFVFGSAVAAAIPVAMGVMTVSITLGLLSLLTLKIDLSVFALNITSMLGLGLGIDYSLLIVNRFREELLVGSVEQAVIRTVDTAGRAVFFSGLTVCIGLISLLIFPILLLQSFGVAGSVVVMLSVVAALTLLPALLAILGERVNLWRVVRLAQRGGFWTFFARKVMRYSVPSVVVILVIVAVFASPFLEARFGLGDASVIPRAVPAREGVEVLKQAFGAGEISPLLLAVSSDPGVPILSGPHISTLYNLVNNLKSDRRIAKVRSIVNIDPRLSLDNYQQLYSNLKSIPLPIAVAMQQLSSDSTTLIVVNSRTDSNDTDTRNLVEELRALSLDDLDIQIGGQPASQVDTIQVVRERFPLVVAAIMVVTFVVLCALLNSVVLPLKAIVINVLSIGASFGALVFIFQEGNFHTWLNFTPVGYLDILLPVILFCVLFGLSMDYEVFLLSRIKEAYDRSGDNSLSVVEGLERTGRIITSAALLMIIVTGAFALTRIIFVKALGLGIAIAVLIDATLIRAILVPASMHLLGKWNWWTPKFLRKQRINFKLD